MDTATTHAFQTSLLIGRSLVSMHVWIVLGLCYRWMAAEPETAFLISSWMMARLQIPEDLRDHSKTRMEAGGF